MPQIVVEHYHFNKEICGELLVHSKTCEQAREFYCHKHKCVVGPSGYEWGLHPCGSRDAYTSHGSWLLIANLVKSLFAKIECSGKFTGETAFQYADRVIRHEHSIKNMRVYLAEQKWKPLVMYSDIARVDYSVILKKILEHNV
jgi:hypothetical protein